MVCVCVRAGVGVGVRAGARAGRCGCGPVRDNTELLNHARHACRTVVLIQQPVHCGAGTEREVR